MTQAEVREYASTLRGLIHGYECDPLGLALTPIAEFLEKLGGPDKPPEGSKWVLVDAEAFESMDTDDGGGTINISNDTNVDIEIACSGNDEYFWLTTEAVVDALALGHVENGDYSHWDDLHDVITRRIHSRTRFFVWLDATGLIFVGDNRNATKGGSWKTD